MTRLLICCLAMTGCTLIAPHEEFRRADRDQPDLANAQTEPGEDIRIGYDCSYSLLGIIPIWGFSPNLERARANVHPPTTFTSQTEAVYFHKTTQLLTVSECWDVWVRFEGAQ